MTDSLEVEASGETIGEAKWLALRELEKRQPGLDKGAVSFQVLSEGHRGLLGVGYTPARVLARVAAVAAPPAAPVEVEESELARRVRGLLERIAGGIGVRSRIDVVEDDETLTASLTGAELGLLIGKHGQTIDAIQYLVAAIVHRGEQGDRKSVVIDAGGYRERRKATLDSLALRSAEQAVATGRPVELEPMSATERKLVHLCLQDFPGVETQSEGAEPHRFVVIAPARD